MLSNTDQLLLFAARDSHSTCETTSAQIAQADIAWEDLSRASRRNRVDSFVADLVAHPDVAPRVAPDHAADWRARGMLSVMRMEVAQHRVRDLGSAMFSVGIRMLVYKGVDFQLQCYPDQQARGFGDLDLVVFLSDVETAAACLEAQGYVRLNRDKSLAYYRRFHLHAVFKHPRQAWPIELHWALDAPFSSVVDATSMILNAAQASSELGPGILRPRAIDTLALMCIHLAKHLSQTAWLPDADARLKAVIMESGLVWLQDIIFWMRRYAAEHAPDEIIDRMRELGVERSYIIALRLAYDLEPDSLPAWVGEQAVRMPRRTPLIVLLVYPDLARGHAVDAGGRRRRKALYTMWQRGGFRPIRLLQLMLPSGRICVQTSASVGERVSRVVRRARLLVANAWILVWMGTRSRRGWLS